MNLNNYTIARLSKGLFIASIIIFHVSQSRGAEADTIFAPEAQEVPVINGKADDACWQTASWNSLNHVWMNWEESVDSADYYGRFKVVWSSQEQLIYILVEVTDDILVERFAEFGEIAHYNDIVEVFIDENASGGSHVFDGTTAEWGYNAENAFSYHVTPHEIPEEGGEVNYISVIDLDGTGWGNSTERNYFDHFPEFALSKTGNKYTWEFSMIVYTDLYEIDSPDDTEALLEEGKVMGLALAYCETDLPDNYQREMFFGSYPGIETILTSADDNRLFGYNDAWKNADHYNTCVLTEAVGTSISKTGLDFNGLDVIFSPDTDEMRIRFSNRCYEDVDISVYSLEGKLIRSGLYPKSSNQFAINMNPGSTAPGLYLVAVQQENRVQVSKLLVY